MPIDTSTITEEIETVPTAPPSEPQIIIRNHVLIIQKPSEFMMAFVFFAAWLAMNIYLVPVAKLAMSESIVEFWRHVVALVLVMLWVMLYVRYKNIVADLTSAMGYDQRTNAEWDFWNGPIIALVPKNGEFAQKVKSE